MPAQSAPRLLAGTRVLDLADGFGATGRFLAELGAEVVMVEPPGGFAARRAEALVDGLNASFVVDAVGKRSVTVDPEDPADQDRWAELLRGADVALIAAPPDQAAERGEAMRQVNPQLVVVALTPFGLWGPYRDFRATDAVYAALSGVLSRSGLAGQDPVVPPNGVTSGSAAIQAAWATVVGLFHARHTGEGQLVDLSLFEATAQILDPPFGVIGSARAAIEGTRPGSTGRGRPDMPYMYPNFECSDGYVRIAALGARQWQGLWTAVGSPAELGDNYYKNMENRFQSWDKIRSYLEPFFRTRTMAELVALGERYLFPVAEMLDLGSATKAEHFLASGTFRSIELPSGVAGALATGFIEVDELRWRPAATVVEPGADNDALPAPAASAVSAAADPAARVRPLAGLRILDLGIIVVGAETGRLMADLGADVVKVENLNYPDGLRVNASGPTVTAAFAWGHRNKRSLGIDLRTDTGRELFKRLVGEADAVLSNFKPGTLRSLGIDYQRLVQLNPKIVVAESSAYGPNGPWSARLGYGPLVRASVGLADLWRTPGLPDGFSDRVTVFPDHVNGRIMASAVLAGVLRARETGVGSHIRSSQAETIINVLAGDYLRESVRPGRVTATGNLGSFGDLPCLYPCAGDDEWCVIEVQNERQLAGVLALAGDAGRPDDAPADRIAAWAAQHGPQEVMWACQRVGVPAGAMARPLEMVDDVHLRSRGHFTTIAQPGLQVLPAERGPALWSTLAQPAMHPAPRFGEHTDEVLAEWLALGEAELTALAAAHVTQSETDAATGGR